MYFNLSFIKGQIKGAQAKHLAVLKAEKSLTFRVRTQLAAKDAAGKRLGEVEVFGWNCHSWLDRESKVMDSEDGFPPVRQ